MSCVTSLIARQRNRPRRANSGASLLSNIGSMPSWMAATSRTPRTEPMISGTRWCGVFAPSSRMRRRPVDRRAARPLHHQRHRMGFVQQTKPSLAIAGAGIGRIEKHAAAHQDAKRLRHQRTDPAHVEIRLAAAAGAGEAFVDIGANRPVPVPAVGGVDGEFRRIGRDPDALRGSARIPARAGRE